MKSGRKSLREEFVDWVDQLDKWTSFVLANLLWSVFALFVVTIPAATAGLFAVMSLRVRGKQPELFQEFFGAMRRLWLKATLIAVIDILVGGLVAFNLFLFPSMDTSNPLAFLSASVTMFVAAVLLAANLYIWSLLVVFDMPLKQLIVTSCKLVFAYPLWTFGVLFAASVPVMVSLLLPQIVFLIVTFACSTYIIVAGTWRIIRKHTPEEELKILEAAHQG